MDIINGFPEDGIHTELFTARTRIPVADHLEVHQSLTRPWRDLPWRLVSDRALRRLDSEFRRALEAAVPAETIAYFYPDPPAELVEFARSRGITTVRELVNTACATSGPILDQAYARMGLSPTHLVDQAKIDSETRELRAYDYFFAPNAEVEKSLASLGFSSDQILSTSFGWSASRFPAVDLPVRTNAPARFIFVGTLNIRKGIPELLNAWESADVPGELLLVGPTDPEVAEIVRRRADSPRVSIFGFVKDVGELFRSSDVFIFPTHEEGGPQVTYEAAACGLPSITTPMGAGRIIVDGQTGIIVDAGSEPQLTEAIRVMASSQELRQEYGNKAKERAAEFEYAKVATEHYAYIAEIMARQHGRDGS